jgi:hypothetical protein
MRASIDGINPKAWTNRIGFWVDILLLDFGFRFKLWFAKDTSFEHSTVYA